MFVCTGTRVSKTKIKQGQEFAKERGLPVLNHVLIPRTKGFVATVQGLRGHTVDVVYDVTVGYEVKPPSLLGMVRLEWRRVHVHVRRWPISSLPKDNEGLAAWCIQV